MILKSYSYTIPAGESRKVAQRGRFIRGTAAEQPYQVRIGDDAAPTKFQTGIAFESPEFFAAVEIINTAPISQLIEIVIADGYVDDNRLVGQVDISGGIRLAGNQSASYGAVTIGTSAGLVAAASTGRGSILVQNKGAAPIYLGTDNSVTTANGIEIAAGGAMSVTLQTAIYAVSGAAGNDVRYLEEAL